MWLGELNPRVTGATSITNVTAVAYGDMPLFLFHLLEFMDVDYEIDVDELNERWAQPQQRRRVDAVHPQADRGRDRADHRGARARGSGGCSGDGGIAFARRDTDWHTVGRRDPRRSTCGSHGAGRYRYPGPTSGSW